MFSTITDVYNAFVELFGSEQPLWDRDQLRTWLQEQGIRYEDVTPEVLDAAYEASFEDEGIEVSC